jgi:hypothetical protein
MPSNRQTLPACAAWGSFCIANTLRGRTLSRSLLRLLPAFQQINSGVFLSPLQGSNIRPIYTCIECQSLLREAAPHSDPPQIPGYQCAPFHAARRALPWQLNAACVRLRERSGPRGLCSSSGPGDWRPLVIKGPAALVQAAVVPIPLAHCGLCCPIRHIFERRHIGFGFCFPGSLCGALAWQREEKFGDDRR